MEWLTGFIVGFITDLFRSVFMPATTEWINKFIPYAREKANLKDNALTLEIMSKLKSLGKDPNLVQSIKENSDRFMSLLTMQQEVFSENAIEIIDSTDITQTEMNMEAHARADLARQQMERAIFALEDSSWLAEGQRKALKESQELWEHYSQAQARFASSEFEGGSMAPLVYSSEIESSAIRRTGELRRILEDMRARYVG